jgi:Integrase core domain
MLNVIDEFTHECLAIRVARKLKATDVIDVLSDLFLLRGVPGHIRSDNGPEFVAKAVQGWITAVGARTAYIAPGSPLQGRHRGPDPCGTGSAAALPMGERLHRELQCPAPGRAARRRDLLQLARGPGGDRELAAALQRGAPARLARLSCAGPGCVRARPRRATGAAGRAPAGTTTDAALTFSPDHPVGAGHLLKAGKCKMAALGAAMRKLVHLCFGVPEGGGVYRAGVATPA